MVSKLSDDEIKLIDESIAAYKRMIERMKSQILDLERKKNRVYGSDCSGCIPLDKILKP